MISKFFNYLKNKWYALLSEYSSSKIYWTISSSYLLSWKIVKNCFTGKKIQKILDLGAGLSVFRGVLKGYCSEYISLDVTYHMGLDVVSDGKYLPFKDLSIDCVFCWFVLEHVDEPFLILKEIRRVLTEEGEIIIGVPLFFYQHGEPFDYHRWTAFGLKYLLEKGGFEVVKIYPFGTLLTLFTSTLSAFLLSATSFPVVKVLGYLINALLVISALPFEIVCDIINKKLNGKFSLGFVALAKKGTSTR